MVKQTMLKVVSAHVIFTTRVSLTLETMVASTDKSSYNASMYSHSAAVV